MDRRKFTLVPIWLAIVAISCGAWATRAMAQTDERRRPSCVTQQGDPCCIPGQGPDDEQGVEADCPPAGRQHRDGGDGQDQGAERIRSSDDLESDPDDGDADDTDNDADDTEPDADDTDGDADDTDGDADDDGNDTGTSNFRRRSGRGSGNTPDAPSGAPAGSGAPGGIPTPAPVSNPVSAPGGATAGAPPATPAPAAQSSPGVRAPSPSTAAGSAATATSGAANAGQPKQAVANTGRDVGTPLSVAMMLLMVGTTLRRATRLRPPRRPPTPGNRRPRHAAAPSWSYVDHSSAARAIEKF